MNSNKIILHLCADIGSDSLPYREAGYNVRCVGSDIGVENYHPPENVYGIIANPPCTNFSIAKTTGKPRDMREGMRLVNECMRVISESQYDLDSPYAKKTTLKFWMLENPDGLLKRFIGMPYFTYSPHEFGCDYKKKTSLWGYFNIPQKNPIVCTKPKFDRLLTKEIHYEGNEHLSRQERRSICSPSFAKAFLKANK